jgi:hypothetical protein
LEDIVDDTSIEIEGKLRHISCSIEYEKMVEELEKIYNDTCPTDIYTVKDK